MTGPNGPGDVVEDAEGAGLAAQGRLALLGTGTNAPAGVLTFDAWQALREADFVYARPGLAPEWEEALAQAGVAVHVVPASMPVPELATRLLAEAADAVIVWFGSPDGDPGLAQALTGTLLRLGADAPAVELLVGSWDEPGSAVVALARVMDRLRSPGGCPWDAEQTHRSLLPYAIEEVYEVVQAVEDGDRDGLVEELGDLLLQVVFHARLGEEADGAASFDLDEVAEGIVAKLLRRHPHVFGDADAPTAADVEASWEGLKQQEKSRASAFDGVPTSLPALARAQKVLGRAERAGVEIDPLLDGTERPLAAEVIALVRRARAAGVDLESELRELTRDVERRARARETSRSGAGKLQAGRSARDGAGEPVEEPWG